MKVVKIIERPLTINEYGEWQLFCQVLRGSSYVYGVIICKTRAEAFAIKEGQILDTERLKFEQRISNI